METKSCTFFGNKDLIYTRYKNKLLEIFVDLIENKGVTHFYSGYHGHFEGYCSYLIYGLKNRYPQIRIIMVLSHILTIYEKLKYDDGVPSFFDDSVYLLNKRVPRRFEILETDKLLVDKVDYIVAGVPRHDGGTYPALDYARKKNKTIISIDDRKAHKFFFDY